MTKLNTRLRIRFLVQLLRRNSFKPSSIDGMDRALRQKAADQILTDVLTVRNNKGFVEQKMIHINDLTAALKSFVENGALLEDEG